MRDEQRRVGAAKCLRGRGHQPLALLEELVEAIEQRLRREARVAAVPQRRRGSGPARPERRSPPRRASCPGDSAAAFQTSSTARAERDARLYDSRLLPVLSDVTPLSADDERPALRQGHPALEPDRAERVPRELVRAAAEDRRVVLASAERADAARRPASAPKE